jgi:hypothetical protein
MILELIKKLKEELERYPNGNLPLSQRVKVAKDLGSPSLINKVYLECCKFVYLEFKINDSSISEILVDAEDFLYAKKEIDFQKIFDKYKNYLESFQDEVYSGVAAATMALCKSIAFNAEGILNIEDYHGQDDDKFDWEEWNTDFYASNVYSGGNPFLGRGNIDKRRIFWNWYLETVLKVYNSPSLSISPKIPLTTLQGSNSITRSIETNNDFVKDKLTKVIDLVLKDLENSSPNINWMKVEVEGQNIEGNGMIAHYFDDKIKKRIDLTYYLYDGDESTVELMQQIKDNIYQQSPREGTWFSYKITIEPDRSYIVNYNFDKYQIYEGEEPDKGDFIAEFSEYPRAKAFVPTWWQEIIEKSNLEYLK